MKAAAVTIPRTARDARAEVNTASDGWEVQSTEDGLRAECLDIKHVAARHGIFTLSNIYGTWTCHSRACQGSAVHTEAITKRLQDKVVDVSLTGLIRRGSQRLLHCDIFEAALPGCGQMTLLTGVQGTWR
ncbi:hypothetical protein ABBQ38_003790 [Trebouxia sp. C0009 RCD-2024]